MPRAFAVPLPTLHRFIPDYYVEWAKAKIKTQLGVVVPDAASFAVDPWWLVITPAASFVADESTINIFYIFDDPEINRLLEKVNRGLQPGERIQVAASVAFDGTFQISPILSRNVGPQGYQFILWSTWQLILKPKPSDLSILGEELQLFKKHREENRITINDILFPNQFSVHIDQYEGFNEFLRFLNQAWHFGQPENELEVVAFVPTEYHYPTRLFAHPMPAKNQSPVDLQTLISSHYPWPKISEKAHFFSVPCASEFLNSL